MIAFCRRSTVTHPWNQVTLTSCTWMQTSKSLCCFRLHRFRLRTQQMLTRTWNSRRLSCVHTAMPTQASCSRYCESLKAWTSQQLNFSSMAFSVTTELLGGNGGMAWCESYPSISIHIIIFISFLSFKSAVFRWIVNRSSFSPLNSAVPA